VNVSIRGGTRVEIKGVPQIGMIEDLCRIEGYRQKALLDLRHDLRQSSLEAKTFTPDRTVLEGRLLELAAEAHGIEAGGGHIVAAQRLQGFESYLDWRTQPGRSFLDEIRGRVRVIACLESEPGVARAPEPLRQAMGVPDEDGLVLLAGPEEDVDTAAKEVAIRIGEAFEGVPSETRQALADGANRFERILPGPDRMYPDTDLPPEPIDLDVLERVRGQLPPSPWDRRRTYGALGVSHQLIARLINWERADMFDSLSGTTEYRPSELAYVLTDLLRGRRRAGFDWLSLGEDRVVEVIRFCDSSGVTLKAAADVLDRVSQQPDLPLEKALELARPSILG
jgi:glutamyl-tRNA(Gln) amidotransferase subunit E